MPRPPAAGIVTSPYGPRKGADIGPGVGAFHYGEDRNGDGNYFPDTGTIVFAGYAGSFGNAILLRNGDVVWNLAHHANLNGRNVGQGGTEGEFAAPMGATGLAFGRHVHTERRTGGGNTIQSGSHSNPADHYTTLSSGNSKPFEPETDPEEDTDMKFFDDTIEIQWPNGMYTSYDDPNDYKLIKHYYLYPSHPEWRKGRDNYVRAANAAIDYVADVTARKVAEKVGTAAGFTPEQVEAIARAAGEASKAGASEAVKGLTLKAQ